MSARAWYTHVCLGETILVLGEELHGRNPRLPFWLILPPFYLIFLQFVNFPDKLLRRKN